MNDGGVLSLARAMERPAKGFRAWNLLNPAALGWRPTESGAHGLCGGILLQQRLHQVVRCLQMQQPWWLAAKER